MDRGDKLFALPAGRHNVLLSMGEKGAVLYHGAREAARNAPNSIIEKQYGLASKAGMRDLLHPAAEVRQTPQSSHLSQVVCEPAQSSIQ